MPSLVTDYDWEADSWGCLALRYRWERVVKGLEEPANEEEAGWIDVQKLRLLETTPSGMG